MRLRCRMAHVFARDQLCERSFPKLTLRLRLSSGDKVCFPSAPTEMLWMTAVIRSSFRVTHKSSYGIFGRVSWPNIGPAAAGPAGLAPTALRFDTKYNSS